MDWRASQSRGEGRGEAASRRGTLTEAPAGEAVGAGQAAEVATPGGGSRAGAVGRRDGVGALFPGPEGLSRRVWRCGWCRPAGGAACPPASLRPAAASPGSRRPRRPAPPDAAAGRAAGAGGASAPWPAAPLAIARLSLGAQSGLRKRARRPRGQVWAPRQATRGSTAGTVPTLQAGATGSTQRCPSRSDGRGCHL